MAGKTGLTKLRRDALAMAIETHRGLAHTTTKNIVETAIAFAAFLQTGRSNDDDGADPLDDDKARI